MARHRTTYTFGDTVYLKTDPDQSSRMVIVIRLTPNGPIYQVACGTTCSDHYEIELTNYPAKTPVMGFTKPTQLK